MADEVLERPQLMILYLVTSINPSTMGNFHLRRSALLAATSATATASVDNSPSPDLAPSTKHVPDPATTSTSMELQSFTYFPRLPPELRYNIWSEACLVERIVDLWIADPFTKYNDKEWSMNFPKSWEWRWITFGSHNRIPDILQTSRESRAVGLKHYSPLLGTEITHLPANVKSSKNGMGQGEKSVNSIKSSEEEHKTTKPKSSYLDPAVIYINWECDIICPFEIPEEHVPRFQLELKLSNRFNLLKKLAIPQDWVRHLLRRSSHGYSMPVHPDLKEVILYPDRRRLFPRDFQVFSLHKPFKLGFSDFDTASDETVSLYDYGRFNANTVRRAIWVSKRWMEDTMKRSHKTGVVHTMVVSTLDLKAADQ